MNNEDLDYEHEEVDEGELAPKAHLTPTRNTTKPSIDSAPMALPSQIPKVGNYRPRHHTHLESDAPATCGLARTITVSLELRTCFARLPQVDMRADGHVARAMAYGAEGGNVAALDCLHYCLPGPADVWAHALYNLLMNNPRFGSTSFAS